MPELPGHLVIVKSSPFAMTPRHPTIHHIYRVHLSAAQLILQQHLGFKSSTMPFDITKCARKNILKLEPYRCAREYAK